MGKASKLVSGFSDSDNLVTKKLWKPRLNIWLHKSMTKSDLIEAAAITLNWLEQNGLQSATTIAHGINISGFDGESAELWEDRGSRTFCKMVLEAFAPAICGLIDWNADELTVQVAHSGMSLLGIAVVALGEEVGKPPKVGVGPCQYPIADICHRILEYVNQFAPSVNSRADQLAAGSPPSPHRLFSAFCEGAGGRTVYLAPGMKSSAGRIGEAVLADLVEAGNAIVIE